MDIERIEKLKELRDKGIITETEFQTERAKAVESDHTSSTDSTESTAEMDTNNYATILHLAQFLGYVIPLLGLILPIVLWQSRKQDPVIDKHGRMVTNWILSYLIYSVIGWALLFVFVGIFVLIALAICNVIFIILGAIKASSGEPWRYPGSISFFKV